MLDEPFLLLGLLLLLILVLVFIKSKQKPASEENTKKKAKGGKKAKKKPAKASESKKTVAPAEESQSKEPVEELLSHVLDQNALHDTQSMQVSVESVDDLTEYELYKQFGYFDKAIQALMQYLSHQDVIPKEMLIELFGLYMDTSDTDGLVSCLEKYQSHLSQEELQEVVLMALELDNNNLEMRVFAEKALGWGVEKVDALLEKDVIHKEAEQEHLAVHDEELINNFAASAPLAQQLKIHKKPNLVHGFKRIFGITAEEINAVSSFMSEEKMLKLLSKDIDYIKSISLYKQALSQAKRPAGMIIDILMLDFKHQNLDNYAQHCWDLCFSLGERGRSVRDRMIRWGYSLGRHPVFLDLEFVSNAVEIREVGLKYGYITDTLSSVKAKQLPLVVENVEEVRTEQKGYVQGVIQDVDELLMYGQITEAVTVLENAIYERPRESQFYSVLFDLYERADMWTEFNEFSIKIRSDVDDLPEEIAMAFSNLMHKMQQAGARNG